MKKVLSIDLDYIMKPFPYIKLHDVKYFLNGLFIHDFGTISLTNLTISLKISWVYRDHLSYHIVDVNKAII